MPDTYMPGTCYYTSTLSFDQDRIGHCTVNLRFIRARPAWVRAYSVSERGHATLLKSLYPILDDERLCEYRDAIENIPAKSVRIYMFRLETV